MIKTTSLAIILLLSIWAFIVVFGFISQTSTVSLLIYNSIGIVFCLCIILVMLMVMRHMMKKKKPDAFGYTMAFRFIPLLVLIIMILLSGDVTGTRGINTFSLRPSILYCIGFPIMIVGTWLMGKKLMCIWGASSSDIGEYRLLGSITSVGYLMIYASFFLNAGSGGTVEEIGGVLFVLGILGSCCPAGVG